MGQPPSDDLRVPTKELEDTEAAADGFHYVLARGRGRGRAGDGAAGGAPARAVLLAGATPGCAVRSVRRPGVPAGTGAHAGGAVAGAGVPPRSRRPVRRAEPRRGPDRAAADGAS